MRKSPNVKLEYRKTDIVTIAVYQLGGALRHIHLEDVAIKAAELSPKAFSWKKYPERINLESVRITLKSELASNDRRVIGSIRDGWMISPKGLHWCISNIANDAKHSLLNQINKEVARAKKTEAFTKTINNKLDEVSNADVKILLRVDEYFSARNRRERVLALSNAALLDPQLDSVLTSLRKRGFIELEVKKSE
ncbi:hypothetical protein ACFLSK_02890 [Chloroflexota bacterium]